MHIHVPKPIHGWKQFFNEVFVIVVGIVIALGGEELLSHWNEERQAGKSFEAIQKEVSINLGNMQARLATSDCLDKRLAEVASYVEAGDERVKPTWVGRPQTWSMQSSAVAAARSYGSLTVLPIDDQMAVSNLYSAFDQFAEIEHNEQWAWAELRSITEDRDLSDSDKASLRQAIQRARYSAWLLKTISIQAIATGKDIEVHPYSANAGSRSVCIPMNTPFDEAVKLSRSQFGEPR